MDSEPAPPSFWRAVGLTFEVTVRNARTCLLLVSAYALLIGVSSAIGRATSFDIDPSRASLAELAALLAGALATFGALALVGTFVYPPTLAALSIVGSAAVAGDELEAGGIVRRVFDRALEVIGAFVLTVLVALVPVAIIGLAGATLALVVGAEAGLAAVVFTLLVLIVPAMYAVVRLVLAVPVVVREGLGPVNALKRSWELVGGNWWWVFGVLVVVNIAGSILASIAATIVSLGSVGFAQSSFGDEPNFFLLVLGNIVQAAVGGALFGVSIGVIYAARARVKPTAELALPDASAPEESAQDDAG
jgi:hypothetical protein